MTWLVTFNETNNFQIQATRKIKFFFYMYSNSQSLHYEADWWATVTFQQCPSDEAAFIYSASLGSDNQVLSTALKMRGATCPFPEPLTGSPHLLNLLLT